MIGQESDRYLLDTSAVLTLIEYDALSALRQERLPHKDAPRG